MGKKFHAYYQPAHPWDADAFAALVSQVPFLSVTDGGFLAGAIVPTPFNPKWAVAQELMWWAEDGKGLAHLRAFRRWAKSHKANEIMWSCHTKNERVQRVYARFSRPVETYYSEVL